MSTSSTLTGPRFLKGHGAENDFVLLPDPDGVLDLPAARVAAVCDRRAGIGADGLLRVVRSAEHPDAAALAGEAEWFMDYRNADGSVAEMCGNGVRVFARHLLDEGLAAPGADGSFAVATRAGVRRLRVEDDGLLTASMGRAGLPDSTGIEVVVGGRALGPARKVDMGNPHAVVFVGDLADAGPLLEAPAVTPAAAFPDGVNVGFAADRGPGRIALRVHERGSGETRACGTGACAAAVAAARRDGTDPAVTGRSAVHAVDLPGGRLTITERPDGEVEMTGPAVITAAGRLAAGLLPGPPAPVR